MRSASSSARPWWWAWRWRGGRGTRAGGRDAVWPWGGGAEVAVTTTMAMTMAVGGRLALAVPPARPRIDVADLLAPLGSGSCGTWPGAQTVRGGRQQAWPPVSVGGGRTGWDRVPLRFASSVNPGEGVLWILPVAPGARVAGPLLCSVPGFSGVCPGGRGSVSVSGEPPRCQPGVTGRVYPRLSPKGSVR